MDLSGGETGFYLRMSIKEVTDIRIVGSPNLFDNTMELFRHFGGLTLSLVKNDLYTLLQQRQSFDINNDEFGISKSENEAR